MEAKCKHQGCRCAVNSATRSDGYCSDSCKQASSSGSQCNCGHPNCR